MLAMGVTMAYPMEKGDKLEVVFRTQNAAQMKLIDKPESQKALEDASGKFKLIAVTNNPVEAARKTLAVLGLEKVIPQIIGLDTCRKSKPAKEILNLALERTDSKASEFHFEGFH